MKTVRQFEIQLEKIFIDNDNIAIKTIARIQIIMFLAEEWGLV